MSTVIQRDLSLKNSVDSGLLPIVRFSCSNRGQIKRLAVQALRL